MTRRPPLPVVLLGGLLVAGIVAYAARAVFDLGGTPAGEYAVTYPYWAIKGLALALLAARVVLRRDHRVAYGLLALGFALSLGGDVAWAGLYAGNDDLPPVPSVADAFYIAAYPAFGAAVLRLIHDDHRWSMRSGLWLDGLVVTLTVLTALAHFVLEPLVASWDGLDLAAVLTNAAYPLGDAILLTALVGALGLRGWQLDIRWAVLAFAFGAFIVSDAFYLVELANETYVGGGVVDLGWLIAGALSAFAAWAPAPEAATEGVHGRAAAAVPVTAGAVGIALLAHEAIARHPSFVIIPACTIAALIFVRFTLASRENHRLIEVNRTDAITDALTGLGNRRRLLEDLERAAARGRVLVLFDLDGFKAYNDTFGHPAGDVLLRMIGEELQAQVDGRGRAYRLGGDEFCALVDVGDQLPEEVGGELSAAMVQSGPGFHVGASFGTIAIPVGTTPPTDALAVADQRLYECKHARRTGADRQSADVLLAVLAERTPDLGEHVDAVAGLSGAVAEHLGLPEAEAQHVRSAAALHDIGKMAIPDAVLGKPGPLDDAEWGLMRQHTVIGERIVSAAPALRPVAALVRSTHERWDGGGYPDGLAGEDIPLGSRIVFACDAFDAMVAERPYARSRSVDEALAEITRCAGSQFDPVVAAALVAAVRARTAEPAAV